MGPYFYWSYPRGNAVSHLNAFSFFWDESNLKDQDTCYINRCDDNPCDPGQECTWGWNADEQSSYVLCDGEGKRFTISLYIIHTICYISYVTYYTTLISIADQFTYKL